MTTKKTTKKKQAPAKPAAAPLPKHIEEACHILRNNFPELLSKRSYGDIVRAHLATLTSRVAELEAENKEVRSRNGLLAVQRADAVHMAKATPTQVYQRIQ